MAHTEGWCCLHRIPKFSLAGQQLQPLLSLRTSLCLPLLKFARGRDVHNLTVTRRPASLAVARNKWQVKLRTDAHCLRWEAVICWCRIGLLLLFHRLCICSHINQTQKKDNWVGMYLFTNQSCLKSKNSQKIGSRPYISNGLFYARQKLWNVQEYLIISSACDR